MSSKTAHASIENRVGREHLGVMLGLWNNSGRYCKSILLYSRAAQAVLVSSISAEVADGRPRVGTLKQQ